jgi:hypothetical protein
MERLMKLAVAALLIASPFMMISGVGPAVAGADDAAWIKRCVSDNADQKQTPEVVAVYCQCMNEKMSDSDTQSITAWEKAHPAEEKACSTQAGWKG